MAFQTYLRAVIVCDSPEVNGRGCVNYQDYQVETGTVSLEVFTQNAIESFKERGWALEGGPLYPRCNPSYIPKGIDNEPVQFGTDDS